MNKTLGVDDVVALVMATADAIDVADRLAPAIVSGSWLTEVQQLPALIAVGREFANVNFAQVLPEVSDMTPEEQSTVANVFATHLNISQATAEETIKTGFDVLIRLSGAINLVRDVIARVKGKPVTA